MPTGSTPYVRLVRLKGGRLTAALTAHGRSRLGAELAGKVLDGSCTTLGRLVQGGYLSSSSSTSEAGIRPDGRVSFMFLLDPHADFCDVGLARLTVTRHRVGVDQLPGPPFDSVALTQKGAEYLDEDRVTARLFEVLQVAVALAQRDRAGHFPPAERVVSVFARTRAQPAVVALAAATDTPPSNAIGVFTDAANHAEIVGRTALGQRLFIDSNSGVLSANSPEHLFRVLRDEVATVISN